jgi:release factor glutamine methyltransferase
VTANEVAAGAGRRGSGEAVGSSREAGDEGPWTVLRLIRWSADYLAGKGVENARLDAELLLAHALETDRLQLYLQFDRPLTPGERDLFRPLLRRRAAREPLQYITGRTGFRELELLTDPRALIPRQETEVLVQVVLDWAAAQDADDLTAVDFGTGSGCISLSLAVEGPFREVWAVDASPAALELAALNAQRSAVAERIHLVRGDSLAALPGGRTFDVVVSNPPYVAAGDAVGMQPEVVEHEPHGALFAGEDGLDVLRALVSQAPDRIRPGGLLAVEIGADQGEAVRRLVEEAGAFSGVTVREDLSGRPRIVSGVRV